MEDVRLQDLQMMYEDCLCRYKGRPTLLTNFMSSEEVEILDLRTSVYSFVPFILDYFDFTPIRIGYVNYRGSAFYFVRNPIRQYKQGTSKSNVKVLNIDSQVKGQSVKHIKNKIDGCSNLNYKEIADAIDRKYPTIPEIITIMKENKYVYSLAFDPQFAISSEMGLFYRGRVVGTVSTEYKLRFYLNFKYLERIVNVNL